MSLSLPVRHQLEAIPVEVEGGRVLLVCATTVADVPRVAWLRDGRRKDPFGPQFSSILDACAASRFLNERNHGLAR